MPEKWLPQSKPKLLEASRYISGNPCRCCRFLSTKPFSIRLSITERLSSDSLLRQYWSSFESCCISSSVRFSIPPGYNVGKRACQDTPQTNNPLRPHGVQYKRCGRYWARLVALHVKWPVRVRYGELALDKEPRSTSTNSITSRRK